MIDYKQQLNERLDVDLIKEAKGLYYSIYISECYSEFDLPLLLSIESELAKRGYERVKSIEYIKTDSKEDLE